MSAFEIMKFIVETVLAIGTVSIAWIAYRQGKKNNDRHNELIEKINSKEHEISENLKYEVLELIAVLRAIDTKATNGLPDERNDYSHEMEVLQRLQYKPEFLLFLKSIEKESERLFMESFFQIIMSKYISNESLRRETHSILENIKKQVNLDEIVGQIERDYYNNWNQLVKEICEMGGVFTSYYYPMSCHSIYKSFIDYFEDDPRIDNSKFPSFIDKMNNLYEKEKDSRRIYNTLNDSCEIYREYAEYLAFYGKLLRLFIIYLVETKHIKEPSIIEYYYIVTKEEEESDSMPYDLVNDEEIKTLIVKYRDEFVEFMNKKVYKKTKQLN